MELLKEKTVLIADEDKEIRTTLDEFLSPHAKEVFNDLSYDAIKDVKGLIFLTERSAIAFYLFFILETTFRTD